MAHVSGHTEPPPPLPIEDQREMFFPAHPFPFYPLDLGLALGIAAAIFMLLAVIIALAVNPGGMNFFRDIFPGFRLDSFAGIIIGLIWSFLSGLVLGLLAGVLYNWRLRRYV